MHLNIIYVKCQKNKEFWQNFCFRSLDVIEINLESNWNGCSLFGVLLGFPCVYTYDTNCGDKNCLSYLELVQIQAFQYQKLVASFTIPQQIYDANSDLKVAIEEWKGKFHETSQEVVSFPSVVM